MKITAAIARNAHTEFTIESAILDEPRADEVLVKIAGVGLCHTDLVARDQFIPIALPAVLGHEGSGHVERVGSAVTKVKPGDRVVVSFDSCGVCGNCRKHMPSYCCAFPMRNYSGSRSDGTTAIKIGDERVSSNFFGQSSFASHALARERNVVKIDDTSLPLEILGPLGCGLQTGAGGVMRSMACPSGSSIAIFGGGPVGLAAVMGALIQGCSPIILVEPMASRRKLALELGAHHVIDPAESDVIGRIREIAPSGVDFAFESSGREFVVQAALASLGSRGLLGLVGVPPNPDSAVPVNLASLITYGHRIHGIVEGDSDLDNFIPELIGHFRAGRFPFDKLIRTYPLERINDAATDQANGACVKAVLIP
ncbi:NAD(P)-dependent alcohol dehydrogenase [Burkholderia sp. Bp9142]|uniref:NAD(P)-dependent alcohol dehydrogenase n=1 Tax=Burkholderia sp. Bp9142 TaxID=2184573 RepID=UPI000F5A9E64|nr:NAD(P)-dependent alcohol dehydrogenase [Burkholderia sp. Bp9142]RQR33230.1 NAD(P)-dependent alcohol dehydrogenase [Burkholderia sp. Bp9142]